MDRAAKVLYTVNIPGMGTAAGTVDAPSRAVKRTPAGERTTSSARRSPLRMP